MNSVIGILYYNVWSYFQYLGNWYAQWTVPTTYQVPGSSCLRAQYGMNDDGTVSVHNIGYDPIAEETDEICGYAYQADPENAPGELTVHFPDLPPGDYWVLDTDFESFTTVYACSDYAGSIKTEYAWVMTREMNPPQEAVDKGIAALENNGIFLDQLEQAMHPADCVYDVTPSCKDE